MQLSRPAAYRLPLRQRRVEARLLIMHTVVNGLELLVLLYEEVARDYRQCYPQIFKKSRYNVATLKKHTANKSPNSLPARVLKSRD